jgi:hypothetical protein
MPAESSSSWVDFMAAAYGPLVRARSALHARGECEPLPARLSEIASARDVGDGGASVASTEHLGAVLSADCRACDARPTGAVRRNGRRTWWAT